MVERIVGVVSVFGEPVQFRLRAGGSFIITVIPIIG